MLNIGQSTQIFTYPTSYASYYLRTLQLSRKTSLKTIGKHRKGLKTISTHEKELFNLNNWTFMAPYVLQRVFYCWNCMKQ